MLSDNPWKIDAIARLLASVLICILLGSVAGSLVAFAGAAHKIHALGFYAANAGALIGFLGALLYLGRPWPEEKFLTTLAVVLFMAYSGFLLVALAYHLTGKAGELQNDTLKTVLAVLSFQAAALVLVHRFLREHHTHWSEAFGFRCNPPGAMLVGLAAGCLCPFIAWGLQGLCSLLLEHLHIQPHEQETVEILRSTGVWWNRALIGVAAILIAPPAEEIVFRGILYPAIKQRGYPRLALWGTAILFGAIHVNAVTFVPLVALALILTWLYEFTGNLLASITCHIFFNAANFAMLYILPWLADKYHWHFTDGP